MEGGGERECVEGGGERECVEGGECCVCVCYSVCLLVCSVGMVFAFLTNQAIKDTIDNIVPTFNNALDNAESFANASVSVS